jgi:hypothetical protein
VGDRGVELEPVAFIDVVGLLDLDVSVPVDLLLVLLSEHAFSLGKSPHFLIDFTSLIPLEEIVSDSANQISIANIHLLVKFVSEV